jgi:hypothetical protein
VPDTCIIGIGAGAALGGCVIAVHRVAAVGWVVGACEELALLALLRSVRPGERMSSSAPGGCVWPYALASLCHRDGAWTGYAYPAAPERLRALPEAIGRDYQSIKRTVLLNCAIAETDAAALAKIGSIERNAQPGTDRNCVRERALIGTPAAIRRRLAAYEQAGAQEMILYMPDAAQLESLRLFAHECMGE